MFRTIMTVLAVCFIIAVFTNPNALKPWESAASHVGGAVTSGVEKIGKAVDKAIK